MPIRDPYLAIDEVLMPWAESRGIKVGTLHRDDIVRSVWVYDKHGNQRAQLWLGVPTDLNTVTVYVAEPRPDLPGKWGESLQRLVPFGELTAVLDEFSAMDFKWAGEGAFT